MIVYDLPVDYRKLSSKKRREVRNQYVREQKGLCHYCQGPLKDKPPLHIQARTVGGPHLYPPGFFEYPVHLHHSHDTGLTIGAVHCRCNAVLKQYHGE